MKKIILAVAVLILIISGIYFGFASIRLPIKGTEVSGIVVQSGKGDWGLEWENSSWFGPKKIIDRFDSDFSPALQKKGTRVGCLYSVEDVISPWNWGTVISGYGCKSITKIPETENVTPNFVTDSSKAKNLAANVTIEDNYTLIWEDTVLVDGQTLKNTLFDTYAKENGFINPKTGRKRARDVKFEIATALVKDNKVNVYLSATWECEDCSRLLPIYLIIDPSTKKVAYQQMDTVSNPHLFASQIYFTLSPSKLEAAYLQIEEDSMKETVWVYDFLKGTSRQIKALPEGETVRGCWPAMCADGTVGGELYWKNSGELIIKPKKNLL